MRVNLNHHLIAMLQDYRTTLEQVDPEKETYSVQRMIHEWWAKEFNWDHRYTRTLKVFDCLGSAYAAVKDYPDVENFYRVKTVLFMLDLVILLLIRGELLLEVEQFTHTATFSWNPEK